MKLDFRLNEREITRAVDNYIQELDGQIDTVIYVPMYKNDSDRALSLERKGIDWNNKLRASWLGRILRKSPQRYFLIHNTQIPNDPRAQDPYPDYTLFITGAEVYPPFEEAQQNELAVAGLCEVLNAIKASKTDYI